MVDEADLVFYIGCRAGSATTERWRSPGNDTAIVHLDSDPQVIAANYRTGVKLVGEAKRTLAALNKVLTVQSTKTGHNGIARVAAAVEPKFTAFNKLAAGNEIPVRPEKIIAELQGVLNDDTIICADPGTPCPISLPSTAGRRQVATFIANRAHGALGYALAASIGAQFARPDTRVIVAMGDGSFTFCAGEMETVTRYNLPITMVVFSNSVFGWIQIMPPWLGPMVSRAG